MTQRGGAEGADSPGWQSGGVAKNGDISTGKCCVINIGQSVLLPELMMHKEVLTYVNSVRDLVINVTSCLSPPDHM